MENSGENNEPMLEAILSLWTDVSSMHKVEEIYQKACQIAVNVSGADRSTFVIFDEELCDGTVKAEFKRNGDPLPDGIPSALGMHIPLAGISEEAPLLRRREIMEYHTDALKTGPFKNNLEKLLVKSVLIVPVIWRDVILGSFSLDSIVEKRVFDQNTRRVCGLLAAQIAVAIQNAGVLAAEMYRRQLLTKLEAQRDELRRVDGIAELRRRIVECAVELCGWRACAMYVLVPDSSNLTYVLDHDPLAEGENGRWPEEITSQESGYQWIFQCLTDPKGHVLKTRAKNIEIFTQNSCFLDMQRAVAVRIASLEDADTLIIVIDDRPYRDFPAIEIEYLMQFAARSASQLEKQDVFDSVWDKLNLEFLHLLGAGPSNDAELAQLLHTFLTMVTANFGLRFNRAIVFTFSEDRRFLEARSALGHLDRKKWQKSCEEAREEKMDKFEEWIPTVSEWHPTPLENWAHAQKPFELEMKEGSAFVDFVNSPFLRILNSEQELIGLPERIRTDLDIKGPVLLAPLHTGSELIGLLMVDRRFSGQAISPRDQMLLKILCKQVALAIHTYLQPSRVLKSLTKHFEGYDVKELERMDEGTLIQEIARHTANSFEADLVGVGLVNDEEDLRLWRLDQDLEGLNPSLLFRPGGLSRSVMNDGVVAVIEQVDQEESNPILISFGAKRAICLPLFVESQAIGAIWIIYKARVGGIDTGTLQRYAMEASSVHANWSGLRNRSRERTALQEIAWASSFPSAVSLMVQHAVSLFLPKAATFWPWDPRQDTFLDSVSIGFDKELPQPARTGITYRILKNRDHVPVKDIRYEENLSTFTVKFLQERGLKSFEGIAVYSGSEPLGVLYLAYGEVKAFNSSDLQRLQTFAVGAATVLRVVRTLDETKEARQAAAEVSRVLAMGDVDEALRAIARCTHRALHCDTVTVYRIDERTHRPLFPPIVEGVRNLERLEREDEPDALRIVPELVKYGKPTVARTEAELGPFRSKFVVAEEIKATVAIPLDFATQAVGLLFASFRHELTEPAALVVEDLAVMFANHFAVAIGNSKRFEALSILSTKIARAESNRAILDCALDTVEVNLNVPLCNIVLFEDGQMRSVAHRGWPTTTYSEVIELDGRSHASFAIGKGRPVAFRHIDHLDEDESLVGFVPPQRLRDAGVVSGLAVPILQKGEPLGAMLAHCQEPRRFTAEDISFLIAVANQFMVAHRSFQRLRVIEAQYKAAEAIAKPRDVGDLRPMLESILKLANAYLIDETDDSSSKIAYATLEIFNESSVVEIGNSALCASEPARFDVTCNDMKVGTMDVSPCSGRQISREDRRILEALASVAGIGASQNRAHRDSMLQLAIMAHGFGGSLKNANDLVCQVENGDAGAVEEFQRKALGMIKHSLNKANELSEKVRYTVQILSRQIGIQLERRTASILATILSDAIQLAKDDSEHLKIEIIETVESIASRDVQIDKRLIFVVCNNLVENALKFSEPGSSVRCSLSRTDRGAVVEVADTGCGISVEEQERIFEVFYRAKEHKGIEEGMGVGLAICKKIISLHHGDLTVYSAGAGAGSTFRVLLPWATPEDN